MKTFWLLFFSAFLLLGTNLWAQEDDDEYEYVYEEVEEEVPAPKPVKTEKKEVKKAKLSKASSGEKKIGVGVVIGANQQLLLSYKVDASLNVDLSLRISSNDAYSSLNLTPEVLKYLPVREKLSGIVGGGLSYISYTQKDVPTTDPLTFQVTKEDVTNTDILVFVGAGGKYEVVPGFSVEALTGISYLKTAKTMDMFGKLSFKYFVF